LGLVAAGTLAYLPVLGTPFLFNDDAFFWSPGATCRDHPQMYYAFAIGRGLFSLLACPAWLGVRTLGDLTVVRWVNFLLMSVAMAVFALHLTRHRMRPRD